MDFNQIARELIPLLGGKENIASAAHCATRLRLVLVDDALADQQAIGKVDGVKGCFRNAGQMQVILGTGVVNKVYAAFIQAEPVPAHCPSALKYLCADHSRDCGIRPADGPARHGENLRLGQCG